MIQTMKKTYNIPRTGFLLGFLLVFILSACKDDFPEALDTSDKEVVLTGIRILNAGADGSTIVEGTINEDTKEISFPRVEPETNVSAIRFEFEASNGAVLESDVYDFGFEEGDAQKTIVLKLLNEPRFREYFATLRLNVPVFGADFSKAIAYDFSNNATIYPGAAATVRGTAFNGEYVMIVDRDGNSPHLLRVSDLKEGNIDPIYLNNTGIAGGTFTLHSGAMAGEHIYAASLSGGQVSPLNIYHWTDPTQAPDVININVATIPGAGVRHGDNMSIDIDENGNGYFFFGDNAATSILRFTVTNYTNVGNPVVLAAPVANAGAWVSYNRVAGTDQYIYTSHDAPIYVLNASGASAFNLSRTAIPVRGMDARVFMFNGERYLLMVTGARTGSEATVLYVYNITRGDTLVEALQIFAGLPERTPVYERSLGGPVNINPTTNTGVYIEKDAEGNDETLYVYGSSFTAGFVVVEIPKSTLDD